MQIPPIEMAHGLMVVLGAILQELSRDLNFHYGLAGAGCDARDQKGSLAIGFSSMECMIDENTHPSEVFF